VPTPIPFGRVGHLLTVPASLPGSIEARFVLDTGIGLNLVSKRLCDQAGTVATTEVSKGRRMSGQEISSSIAILSYLQLGDHSWRDLKVSPLDMAAFHPMLRDLGGFLSLGLFESLPFTIDYVNGVVRLHEDGDRSFVDQAGYEEVPVYLERGGPSVAVHVDIDLPDGSTARVEVDSGSDSLILHERFMAGLGVIPGTSNVRSVEAKDETGYPYVRHFAPVKGEFRLTGAPSIGQADPTVMFQRIIYDGLLGDGFLQRYCVTFDLGRSRIGFAPPSV
jgi:Aspartyl protease